MRAQSTPDFLTSSTTGHQPDDHLPIAGGAALPLTFRGEFEDPNCQRVPAERTQQQCRRHLGSSRRPAPADRRSGAPDAASAGRRATRSPPLSGAETARHHAYSGGYVPRLLSTGPYATARKRAKAISNAITVTGKDQPDVAPGQPLDAIGEAVVEQVSDSITPTASTDPGKYSRACRRGR